MGSQTKVRKVQRRQMTWICQGRCLFLVWELSQGKSGRQAQKEGRSSDGMETQRMF